MLPAPEISGEPFFSKKKETHDRGLEGFEVANYILLSSAVVYKWYRPIFND